MIDDAVTDMVEMNRLADISEAELKAELKRRETAKLKEEYERRNRTIAAVLHHKKALIDIAKEMGNDRLIRMLEDEQCDCADYRVEISIVRDHFLDKCYPNGKPLWD